MIRKGIRIFLCIVLVAAVYVLQTGAGLRFSVFGTHIDLLPLVIAASGIVMGPMAGLICGIAVGILYDISGSSIEGIYPLYYMICGIGCGTAGKRFRGGELLSVMLSAVGMMVCLSVLQYIFYFQFNGIDVFSFGRRIVLQAALTIVLSPVVLFLVRRISGRKRKKNTALLNE